MTVYVWPKHKSRLSGNSRSYYSVPLLFLVWIKGELLKQELQITQSRFKESSATESPEDGMWYNNTQINLPNQIELMPHFKIQIWQNRSRSGQSLRMALGGCLSHHTCKMKSCAPPGMHGTCVIHHIRHYQSFNDGFSSTHMLAFLSQSSDFSFSPPK